MKGVSKAVLSRIFISISVEVELRGNGTYPDDRLLEAPETHALLGPIITTG